MLDNFVAFVLVIFSHLIFLLGFREEAYTNFPEFFIPFDSMTFLNIFIGIIFFILHGVGFFSFMKSYLSRDKRYLIFIFILIPTLISVAHLRYFMPFIPLSLIGFSMLIDTKINSTYFKYFRISISIRINAALIVGKIRLTAYFLMFPFSSRSVVFSAYL